MIGVEAWQLPAGSRAARSHARLARWAAAVHMYVPALSARLRARMQRLEQRYARPVRVRADHGVVLASGGFVFNRQLLGEYAPRYLDGLPWAAAAVTAAASTWGVAWAPALGA